MLRMKVSFVLHIIKTLKCNLELSKKMYMHVVQLIQHIPACEYNYDSLYENIFYVITFYLFTYIVDQKVYATV